jgi:hypothetical protein
MQMERHGALLKDLRTTAPDPEFWPKLVEHVPDLRLERLHLWFRIVELRDFETITAALRYGASMS